MNTAIILNIWRKRWVRFSVYAALMLIILLVAAPYAARYNLEQWLANSGAARAEIADIDINPFTGTVSLKGMDVKFGGQSGPAQYQTKPFVTVRARIR